MTQLRYENHVFVACHRKETAECFGSVNKIEKKHLMWISETNKLRFIESIVEIWVLGEISSEIAETLDYFKRFTGTVIRYAEPNEKVRLKRG